MPGLDYHGFESNYERGNLLVSLPGAGLWAAAALAGSNKYGIGAHAGRQIGKARTLGAAARSLRGSWGTGFRRLSEIERDLKEVLTLEGKSAKLRAKARSNRSQAKSLRRFGTGMAIVQSVAFGFDIGKAMMEVGGNYRIRKQDLAQQRRKVYNEDTFMDSRAAFTQRQRAIQVIHNSQMGVRSAMGSEASFLHY